VSGAFNPTTPHCRFARSFNCHEAESIQWDRGRERLPALRRCSLLIIGMLFIGQRGDALPLSTDADTHDSRATVAPVRSSPPPGFSEYSSFSSYKQHLAARAHLSGISPSTIDDVIPDLSLNPRVIELDRAQPGNVRNPNANPPFAPYRLKHVTPALIAEGRAGYSANYSKLAGIRERTGVDPAIPISIFGHEARYGAITGNFDLLDALATLAYEGRRRAFFENEFLAALRLIDRGTPRSRLRGSWAGATGYPQFMPSAILRLAIDGDGDGGADIWTSQADAFASIGNFLKEAGWRPNVPWGIAVRTPSGLDREDLRNQVVARRCPRVLARHSRWLTMREWSELGVTPLGRSLPDDEPASLLEPDGPRGTGYLLTSNYRAILAYNCSNFYALTVGLLADKIEGR
jgi:membrane-bound lytic murein transglycosylase B